MNSAGREPIHTLGNDEMRHVGGGESLAINFTKITYTNVNRSGSNNLRQIALAAHNFD